MSRKANCNVPQSKASVPELPNHSATVPKRFERSLSLLGGRRRPLSVPFLSPYGANGRPNLCDLLSSRLKPKRESGDQPIGNETTKPFLN